jgi:predicted nucleotidyltransferase
VTIIDGEIQERLEELLEEATDDASFEQALTVVALPDWEKQALRDAWRVERDFGRSVISLADLDPRETARDRDAFIATMRDPAVRTQLEQAVGGPGSWRRFRHALEGFYRERKQWFIFQDECRRRHATEWFAASDIEVEWILPAPSAADREDPPPRTYLLEGVLRFTRSAAQLPGVTRIALLGSLTRDEPDPKDADVLVTVADDMDLTALAKAGRRLAGHAQQKGRGADVFLANPQGDYIGRACHWRDCGPGIRASCDAQHCGRRHYLHDDFSSVRLDHALVVEPPLELWPAVHARVPVPTDVESVLLRGLRASGA